MLVGDVAGDGRCVAGPTSSGAAPGIWPVVAAPLWCAVGGGRACASSAVRLCPVIDINDSETRVDKLESASLEPIQAPRQSTAVTRSTHNTRPRVVESREIERFRRQGLTLVPSLVSHGVRVPVYLYPYTLGPSRLCLPRHTLALNSRHEGVK